MSKMPRSWSYSEYSLASECPRKYQYIVLEKEPHPAEKSGDARFGSAMHCALHSMFEEPNLDYMAVFRTFWDSALKDDLRYGRYGHAELASIAEVFLNRFKARYAPKMKPFQMEERLFLDTQTLKLQGTPDFVGTVSGIPSLIDFKTSAYRYHKLKPDASLQLHLYAYLAQKLLKYPVKELHYFVFLKGEGSIQHQKIEYSENTAEMMLKDMSQYTQWVDSLDGDLPRNHNACLKGKDACEFFSKCHPSS